MGSSSTETIILAFFSRGPAHGYELKKAMDLILDREGSLNNNALYPRLKTLQEEGLIERTGSPGSAATSRITYRITERGSQELLDRLSRFTEADASASDAFLLRFAFFGMLAEAERRRILDLRLAALERHRLRHADLTRSYSSFLASPWLGELLAFQERQVEEEIAWLRERASELDAAAHGRGRGA
jgi:DNA-binding PadR family transcriptional regulator